MNSDYIIGGLVLAVPFILITWAVSRLSRALDDPLTYVENLGHGHRLGPGPVAVQLIRQSGNEYRNLGAFQSADDGIRAVQASFRRAGIHRIRVLKNRPGDYRVGRRHFSGRGSSEGKKLARAIIIAIQ